MALYKGHSPAILDAGGAGPHSVTTQGGLAVARVIRTVCAHDCPDMCSILAHVEDGRLLRVEGDPAHPVTAGFLCAKVSREPELVHSRERVLTPLRRTGSKGIGRFAPIGWDAALDEIVGR